MLKTDNFVTTLDTKNKGGRPKGSTAVLLTVGRVGEIAAVLELHESHGRRLTPLVKALARKWEVSERVVWDYARQLRTGALGVSLKPSPEGALFLERHRYIRTGADEVKHFVSLSTLQKLGGAGCSFELYPSQIGAEMTKRFLSRMFEVIKIGNELQNAKPSEISRLEARVDALVREADRDVAELERNNENSTTLRPHVQRDAPAPK